MDWTALFLSLRLAGWTVLILLPVSILMGRFLAYRQFRSKGLVEALVMLPLVLPPTVFGYYIAALVLKRKPEHLYASREEEAFWRSVRLEPSRTAHDLLRKFQELERRLRAAEARVTSTTWPGSTRCMPAKKGAGPRSHSPVARNSYTHGHRSAQLPRRPSTTGRSTSTVRSCMGASRRWA
jgi:hypothetical protein